MALTEATPQPPKQERHVRLHRVELAFLTVTAGGLLALFALALVAIATADIRVCANALPATSAIGPLLAAVALTGFACGRVVANVRKWIHDAPALVETRVVRTDRLMQGLLALFLVTTAVLLGYETYGVAHFDQAPPITEYVRCAAFYHPWLSGFATAAVTVLLGSWIWYPSR